MRVRAGIVVGIAMLVGASGAQAKQRFASPTGSGTACTQVAPCELKEAVKKAQTNDEVIVGSGSYTVAETLLPEGGASANIHGDLAGPRPQISGAVPGALITELLAGARVAYLDLTNSQAGGSALTCAFGGTTERVVARASGEAGSAIRQEGSCTIRDSLAIATGLNGIALRGGGAFTASTAIVRNLTAIATGANSKGISFSCGICIPGALQTLDMRNVIADGVAADLEAPGGETKVLVGNSNLTLPPSPPSSITNLGGNQTTPPLFVNAAAGDYREAPGSPTIDAGSTDQIGTLDLDGNSRTLGSAPDIGAFEYVPLPPPTPPAGAITSLAIAPKAFKALNAGGATFSKASKKGKKTKAPVGATVSYTLTGAAAVTFTVEQVIKGRKVGKKCKPQTAKNKKGHKECSLPPKPKGSFPQTGAAGTNSFKFSGRPIGTALGPGSYTLNASAGGATKTATFTIAR